MSVSEGITRLEVACADTGVFSAFPVVDGQRPRRDAQVFQAVDEHPQLVVSGVTRDTLAAGAHSAAVGIDFPFADPGPPPGALFKEGGSVSAIVLG